MDLDKVFKDVPHTYISDKAKNKKKLIVENYKKISLNLLHLETDMVLEGLEEQRRPLIPYLKKSTKELTDAGNRRNEIAEIELHNSVSGILEVANLTHIKDKPITRELLRDTAIERIATLAVLVMKADDNDLISGRDKYDLIHYLKKIRAILS